MTIIRPRVPKDRVAGCVLVPLHKRKAKFPMPQDNIVEGTYYRVERAKPNVVRCMVTVMPDGLLVAWESCSKCKRHVQQCKCKDGFYHPASIGWIRATYDHPEWPARRIEDYSTYYDPFMRLEAKPSVDKGAFTYVPPPTHTTTKAKKTPTMTVEEIEAIDMAKVQQEAEQTAKKSTRILRKKITKKEKK